jgi:bacterioferritin
VDQLQTIIEWRKKWAAIASEETVRFWTRKDARITEGCVNVEGVDARERRRLGTTKPKSRCYDLPCSLRKEPMAESKAPENEQTISRHRLAELLNEDLSREYQAIIGYVVYSQVLKGAEYMNIADQLEIHAKQELDHALIIARQIDYLGEMPVVTPKAVKTSENAKDMLRFDLENEGETIRNYRERVRQCEALGEYAMAEQIRQILINEQDHQIDLATALGVDVPNMSEPKKGSSKK